MAIGTPECVVEVGRVRHDDVERAVDAIENIGAERDCVRRAGERRVDARESQRGCVDVGHQHARFRRVLGDEDTARPGAAADIDGVSDGCGSLLQASFDRARKAVCVGADKHRIRVFCRKGGMEEQLSCKRGHANAAAQNRVLFNENARFSHGWQWPLGSAARLASA